MRFHFRIVLILFLSFPPLLGAAGPDSEVTHGVTGAGASADAWWDIPYPDRFDPARLGADQDLISVRGNAFVDESGETFVFRGVNIGDPDKLHRQDRWSRRLFEEIADWGANTVRVPVHPVAWRTRGDRWYFERLDEAVVWANALGLYLIIDWHSIGNLQSGLFQHPMYRTSLSETMDFWRLVAWRYRGVPTTAVYEVFNEPTDNYIGAGAGSLGPLDWTGWRDTLEALVSLIQVYDPEVVTLVGGMNWAYSLDRVTEQPVRRERVAYAAHAYPQKANPEQKTRQAFYDAWERDWGHVAADYPIIASEIGWVREDGYNAHIPVIDNSGSYGPNLVNYMLERGISWTVWNFDTGWAPVMIRDWDFTPSEQGRFFRYVMRRAQAGTLTEAVIPSPRVTEYEWMTIARWRAMHEEDRTIAARGGIDLLFLGDSITEGWPAELWAAHFAPAGAANFGIGGDQTQNVLWRLRNGAKGRLSPETVVLMIGVNNLNLGGHAPAQVALGIEAVVDEIAATYPDAEVVLLGVLPFGERPGTPERRRVEEVNAGIAALGDRNGVRYHDIGAAFLEEDGSIAPETMADFLHPTEKGYAVFARELDAILNPDQ
jgi:endoglucanase